MMIQSKINTPPEQEDAMETSETSATTATLTAEIESTLFEHLPDALCADVDMIEDAYPTNPVNGERDTAAFYLIIGGRRYEVSVRDRGEESSHR
jgi:hypothetical protein